MKTYQKFLRKEIDLAPLGVEKHTNNIAHFCTPKGANFIGWAGVDGIHFCFIRGFGEMVFSVSPMNLAPEYVHPLARTFEDFLRLLLACGDSAALEQKWQWDKEQFLKFLEENPPTEEQNAVMQRIAEEMKLTPMEDAWEYMTELQAEFDDQKIKYTEDYYDIDMNPNLVREKPIWKVNFDGGFWNGNPKERAGAEIPVGTEFDWADRHWIIPAVYSCSKGLVVDFCMQVELDQILAFRKKWDVDDGGGVYGGYGCDSREQSILMELEDPFAFDFKAEVCLNGKVLTSTHGYGSVYDPCLPEDCEIEDEGKQVVEHYGLDPNTGWMIWRSSYPWATKRRPEIKTLSVTMEQQKVSVPGPHFQVQSPGDRVSFTYPEGGTEYTLTVQEYEAQSVDMKQMRPDNMEFPTHYHVMTYTITPEIPDSMLSISDCAPGDRPREIVVEAGAPVRAASVSVIGIIGGSSGPTVLLAGTDRAAKLRAACSSLHFEPVDRVEWRMVFHETQYAEMTVRIEMTKGYE